MLKRAAELVARKAGTLGVARRRIVGRTLILAYHNVVPDDAPPGGDLPLHIPISRFRAHLDAIQELCDVVSLAEWRGADGGRPRCVITFDDAYHGALTLGLAELAKRGIPSTMFVAPSFLGGATFWWDDIARQEPGGLSVATRSRALDDLRGRDADIRRALLLDAAGASVRNELRCGDVATLARAVAAGPVTIGSHTWTHPNLAQATDDELREELARSRDWVLYSFPGASAPFVSYPYGLMSGAVREAAIRAGYAGGLLVMGGWAARDADPFVVPRKNVPAGLSADGLALRLTGILVA